MYGVAEVVWRCPGCHPVVARLAGVITGPFVTKGDCHEYGGEKYSTLLDHAGGDMLGPGLDRF